MFHNEYVYIYIKCYPCVYMAANFQRHFSYLDVCLKITTHTLFFFLIVSLQTLMLVSSTTRPLLGCLWDFSSATSGLIFATTSMVIHEIIPIILMSTTNLGSLFILYTHGNAHRTANKGQDAPVIRRVPAERRAAKVTYLFIMYLSINGYYILCVSQEIQQDNYINKRKILYVHWS